MSYTVYYRLGSGDYDRAIYRPPNEKKAKQYAREIYNEDKRRDVLVKDEDGKICFKLSSMGGA